MRHQCPNQSPQPTALPSRRSFGAKADFSAPLVFVAALWVLLAHSTSHRCNPPTATCRIPSVNLEKPALQTLTGSPSDSFCPWVYWYGWPCGWFGVEPRIGTPRSRWLLCPASALATRWQPSSLAIQERRSSAVGAPRFTTSLDS